LPLAFTRAVSPRLAEGELTHLERAPIDMALARAQHRAYERALTAAGLTVRRLAPLPGAPDGVFVEDTAIVLGAHAVITRPGAPSRRGETASTAAALRQHLKVHTLGAGRLDGGDVLLIERNLYVGASRRTDAVGIAALRETAAPLGYAVTAVEVRGCLHLKTCATHAGRDAAGDPLVIVDPRHVDPAVFAGARTLRVGPKDADAANTVRAADTLLIAAGHPALSEALAARGFTLIELDTSEFRKAEAALSCLSLIAMEAG
jgi:dimethylargininase